MMLGYIHVWGIGTANVTEVNLTYGGVTGKPEFNNEKDKEVSDIWMCFYSSMSVKHLHDSSWASPGQKQNYKLTVLSILLYSHFYVSLL